MTLNNFYSVIPHLKTMFGLSVDEHDVEDIGLEAWDKIGNRRTNLYTFTAETTNCRVPLPCNVLEIEAVTNDFVPFQKTDNKLSYNYSNEHIEEYAYSLTDSFFQTKGSYIDYELNDDMSELIFKFYQPSVTVLYKGLQVDDNGLPYLTDREKSAIAEYIAYVVKFKEGMMTNNASAIELSSMINQKWKKSCANARISYINQNEWDKILNAKTSWDRKSYNTSFKPVY